jgi:hypothetical protein
MSGPLSIDRIVELKRERDEARAEADMLAERLAAANRAGADAAVMIHQARAIARELAAALELSEPPWTGKTRAALERFRAHPWAWAKDDAKEQISAENDPNVPPEFGGPGGNVKPWAKDDA